MLLSNMLMFRNIYILMFFMYQTKMEVNKYIIDTSKFNAKFLK